MGPNITLLSPEKISTLSKINFDVLTMSQCFALVEKRAANEKVHHDCRKVMRFIREFFENLAIEQPTLNINVTRVIDEMFTYIEFVDYPTKVIRISSQLGHHYNVYVILSVDEKVVVDIFSINIRDLKASTL